MNRYKFIKEYSACPTGYAQTECKPEQKKTFHTGDVVWGSKWENSVGGGTDQAGGMIQGYGLDVDGFEIPLPPLDASPVIEYPLFTTGRVIAVIVIGIIIYIAVKVYRGL